MKTKNLILSAAMLLFLVVGCNKDEFYDEESELTLKSANVPIPMKGEMCMTYNHDVPLRHVDGTPYGPIPDLYVSGEAWLTGNMTHMGKLSEESWMRSISAQLDMDALSQGRVVIAAVFEATVYGANGDYTQLITQVRLDVTDPDHWTITGDWEITGGSGRYENNIGSGVLSGDLPCWDVEGTLVCPDKNKLEEIQITPYNGTI